MLCCHASPANNREANKPNSHDSVAAPVTLIDASAERRRTQMERTAMLRNGKQRGSTGNNGKKRDLQMPQTLKQKSNKKG